MIWIVTATTWEARPLAERLGFSEDEKTGFRGRLGGHDAFLLEMGMGPERARGTLDQALAALGTPEWIVHTGFASAAQPGIPSGTLVFDVWGESTEVRDLAKQVAAETGLPYQLGPIRSPERLLSTPAEKAAFGREKRALAVDMESETVRDWARAHALPHFAAKVILDALDAAPPKDTPAGAGAPPGAAYLVEHWRDLPSLVGRWRQQRRSIRTLADFLKVFAPRLPAAAPRP